MDTDTGNDTGTTGVTVVETNVWGLGKEESLTRRARRVQVTGRGTETLLIRPTGFDDVEKPEFLPVGLMVCLTQAACKIPAWKQYAPGHYASHLYEVLEVVEFQLRYEVLDTATVEVRERITPDSIRTVPVSCHRLPLWWFTTTFKVGHGSGVSVPMLRTLLEFAGKKIGLGLQRPALGGINGRFLVENITGFPQRSTNGTASAGEGTEAHT